MPSVEVQGVSLAAIVCADVLARQGVPVRLTVDNPELLARSFRGLLHFGRRIEAGARLLELDYGDPEVSPWPDPRGYEPGEHRWHMGLIREYLLGHVNPVEAKIWISREGHTTPDFLLTSNLQNLPAACSEWELSKIAGEALAATRTLGPDGLDQRGLLGLTYRAASIVVHGWTFHKCFVEPLLDKILGTDGDLPAVHHRRVWLPLFTPGELLEATRGASRRPIRVGYSGMGRAVASIVKAVEPLIGAQLPPGPVDVVQDAPRDVLRTLKLRYVWTENPLPPEPAVVWRYGGPVFRGSQLEDGLLCWEMSAEVPAPRSSVLDREALYALGETAKVDCQAGFVGVGSCNEQIIQGISAAAWRLNGDL